MRRIILSYASSLGEDIRLAGEFNEWVPDGGIETVREDGQIRKILHVGPGDYQYRLVVNGNWCNDPQNPRRVLNGLGVHNSLLHVPAQTDHAYQ